MKKIIILPFIMICIFSYSNSFSVEKEFTGKIGTSYAQDIKSWGLDVSLNYMYLIDPYFVAGPEVDFFWNNWNKTLGYDNGTPQKRITSDTDAFAAPVFFNAQVRLPFLVDKIFIEPSLTVGLGYTLMMLTYDQPDYVSSNNVTYKKESVLRFYHGFAWQVLASASLKPSADSKVQFVLDFGFRGTEVGGKDNDKVDLSGILIRVGVRMKI